MNPLSMRGARRVLLALSIVVVCYWAEGNSATRPLPLPSQQFVLKPTQALTASFQGAVLEIPAGAVTAQTIIGITALQAADLASIDATMTNTTNGPRGYRFTPHGSRFKKSIIVKLPYAKSAIPPGLNENDLYTFFFDDQTGTWQMLDRVKVDTVAGVVVSVSDHFTDMINATITVPDHPTPVSFNPTSIKDIKAADPGSGINLIDPPQPTNYGTANLRYVIEVPPGRGGMQPNFAVQYDSAGKSGWMGLGWDVARQAVTIDTRWGVPRYDNGQIDQQNHVPKETETYLLNGEQLTPVAHRGELQDRNLSGDKEFHTRVEGMFRKIIRHGNDPTTYSWEVIDKEGMHYFYGCSGADCDATLTDPDRNKPQNIFEWALHEVRDTHGNTISYKYEHVMDAGVSGGTVPGVQLYLKEIRYTGFEGAEGPYSVVFTRDHDVRPDVMIDCRSGFKMVTADRLARIDVKLNDELIRSYEFEYEIGAFQKSLLKSITQRGTNDEFFNKHEFEYFDEVTADPASPTILTGFYSVPEIGGATTIAGDGVLLAGTNSTALEAEVTSSSEVHGSAGISLGGLIGFGGNGGSGSADSVTDLTLLDINGDGLPDQLYARDDKVFFRRNTGGPTSTPDFGDEVELPSLTRIGTEHSDTTTYGGSVTVLAKLSDEKCSTQTYGHAYLTDVNGDLLPDLVLEGQIYFNRLVAGVPAFDVDNPVPVTPGAPANTKGLVPPNPDQATLAQTYHLLDPIRRWVAPYPGTVSISGQVRLLNPPSAGYTTADGVRASVQRNGAEIWSVTIGKDDLNPKPIAGLGAVAVNAGDRIYFRVNSILDGAFDEVGFNPTITYTSGVGAADVDENGMALGRYTAALDYAYGGRPALVAAPVDGTVTLVGTLVKPAATTDAITFVVRKGFGLLPSQPGDPVSTVFEQTLSAVQVGEFPISVTFDTVAEEPIQVFVECDSRVDLTGIRFVPRTASDPADPTRTVPAALIYDTVRGEPAPTFPNGDPVFVFNPTVTMQTYPRNGSTLPYLPFVAPNDGSIHVQWCVAPLVFGLDSTVTLSVKRPGELLAKQRVVIRGGVFQTPACLDADIDVQAGDALYFVADAPSSETAAAFLGKLDIFQPVLSGAASGSRPFDLHLGIASDEAFGGGFRFWSYGQYNGDLGPSAPIDESVLHLPDSNCTTFAPWLPQICFSNVDPVINQFLQMVPYVDDDTWRAQDVKAFISHERMSASRLGPTFLDFSDGSGLGGGDRGVVRLGGAKTTSGELSLFDVASVGTASGTNWSSVEFLDFNGDGYPDVVGNGMVQLTLPNGALLPDLTTVGGFSLVRESSSQTSSVGLGAAIPIQVSDSRGKLDSTSTDKPSFNLSVGVVGSCGTFDGESDLLDINGDGLPDLVRKTGSGLLVQLNLGTGFGAPETWGGSNTLRFEETVLTGGSLGLGGSFGSDSSFSIGGGIADTTSTTAAQQDLVDLNGDGLLDIVIKNLDDHKIPLVDCNAELSSTTTTLTVRFNTGNGFTQPYTLTGAMPQPLRTRVTYSRSAGANASVGIPIGPIILSFGGGGSSGRSLGGFEVMVQDLDGDNYADYVYSDTSGSVQFNLNAHGRTNLLKTIRRPLGAVIALDYARDGNTTDLPQSRWDLVRVDTCDGHPGDGVDTLVTTYRYEGGRYDRIEREFYGYRTVVVEQRASDFGDALVRSTTQIYLNDSFYSNGLMEREILTDQNDNKFKEEINTYRFIDVATQSDALDLGSTTATVFPQLVRTDQLFYEGQAAPGVSTYTTHKYDAFGNPVEFFDAGDTGSQDDVTAVVGYFLDLPNYIVGKANSIRVTGSVGNELRRREATIQAGTGDETQVRQFLADGQAAVTDLEYFDNGNLKTVTGPANLHGQRYSVGYQYDDVVQTYIKSAIDSFGYQSTASYNLMFGREETVTDSNGNQDHYEYDSFGRLIAITGPYETGGTNPTVRFEYHPDAPGPDCECGGVIEKGLAPWAITRHLDVFRDIGDPIDTVVFIDGLKRFIQIKKDATIHTGPDSPAEDRMIVSGRVIYDDLGRKVEEFYPITEPLGTPGVFNTGLDAVTPTRTEYDVLDRVTRTTLPDNTSTATAYDFGSDRNGVQRFQATVTDANGVRKRTYRDVRELIVSIQEINNVGAQLIWTSYVHDPLKQLVSVEDDHHNVTQLAYDNLGRCVNIDNRDSGRTESRYDLAGNLIAKIVANLRKTNQQISYDYDFNRLKSISYPQFLGNNVSYTYGGPGAPFNRAGRIARVTDGSGNEERFYGRLGEQVKEIKTIVGFTGSPASVYTTEYLYDTFNRLQVLVYPDAEVLTYEYDSGGNLRAATGVKNAFTFPYIQRLEYDKFEQRAFMRTQNGIDTAYTYRPDNRRLANLQAGATGGSLFQNLNYTYDNVGNILQTQNDVPVPPPSQFGGPVLQRYTYDDLYRLVSASGSHQFAPDKLDRYSFSQTYDTIHNITAKNQLHEIVQPGGQPIVQKKDTYTSAYMYNAFRPHAPSHIGDRTFVYDADGNQVAYSNDRNGTRRNTVWDEENRIQSIADNGHVKSYKYDDSGERVLKRGPQGETAYVNQYFTVRNGSIATKHVYAGAVRVASKLSPGFASPQANGVPEVNFLYFYHPDHLQSTCYVTDVNGKLYQHLQYFPFGETWVEERTNTQRTPYLFTAKELDEETDLYYFGGRYLDPRIGLFVSTDPLGTAYDKLISRWREPKNLNMYTYAHQNPLRFVDPDGRELRFAKDSTKEFKQEYQQSIAYLKKADRRLGNIITKLEKDSRVFIIKESSQTTFTVAPEATRKEDKIFGTIEFNPKASLGVPGGYQSPALGLYHELGHAFSFTQRLDRVVRQELSEQETVDKYETPAARILGEPIRERYGQHGGQPEFKKGPTYHKKDQ